MHAKRADYTPVKASVKASLEAHPQAVVVLIALITASVVTSLLPPLVLKEVINSLTAGQAIPFTLAGLYLFLVVVADLFETAQNSAITISAKRLRTACALSSVPSSTACRQPILRPTRPGALRASSSTTATPSTRSTPTAS